MAKHLTSAGIRAALNKVGAAAEKTITGATNATPIVITATSHGYSTGDVVAIHSVGGNVAANKAGWTITTVDANSFSLDTSVGNGGYTSGGKSSRLTAQLLPSDLDNLIGTLSRVPHVHGSDANPGAESNIETLLGSIVP